jgi:hypothetical protein
MDPSPAHQLTFRRTDDRIGRPEWHSTLPDLLDYARSFARSSVVKTRTP